jgi:hypothetical protein
MADTRSLAEWTLTLRKLTETDEPGLWVADEMLCDDSTRIHLRTVANPEVMTVDYHCAWDQAEHLWMIYLLRVVDARPTCGGRWTSTGMFWTSCDPGT